MVHVEFGYVDALLLQRLEGKRRIDGSSLNIYVSADRKYGRTFLTLYAGYANVKERLEILIGPHGRRRSRTPL